MSAGLTLSRRIRRTPYTARVEAHGASGFSVVNHMLLPKAFQRSVEEDYWHLHTGVQLWDVACQRQVEISGPDAARLVQWMTPRDLRPATVGACLYLPLVDEHGGMLNDPVLLKLAEDRYWLSIADADVLLWAKGLALGAGLAVQVDEPAVSPLAVQGPRAEDLMAAVFGERIRALRHFRFAGFDFDGTRQVVARSGYSTQDGFEIYLDTPELGAVLWDTLWAAGETLDVAPGCPNLIDRVEGGLLSYGNEMTRENNPLECGMARYCRLDGVVDCIGLAALQAIERGDVQRQIRGVLFDGDPCPPCGEPWAVRARADGRPAGQVTSAVYSPRLQRNVGLAMIAREFWEPGQTVAVLSADGVKRNGIVTRLPFTGDPG